MGIDGRLMRPRPGRTLLLFGSLALSFDAAAFSQLCKTVVETEDHSWILKTIVELPQCWDAVTAALGVPTSQAEAGRRQLEDLGDAFQTGKPLETLFPLPNKVLVPLVVISQLIQYAAFLSCTSSEPDHRIDHFASSTQNTETLGFCTGLLSAFAVSSACSKEEFIKYGAVAVRLGMIVGMVADMDVLDKDTALGASKAISTEWASAETFEEMLRILKDYPDVSKRHP
jgi:hypothetical protein